MFVLIFVTVGSRNYQFNRLFKKIDELYEQGEIKCPTFAQVGSSTYRPKHFEYRDYISQDEFAKKIESANIVISHGASGTIMKALKANKKIIVVTRLEKYGEHIDDHQIQNNEVFSNNSYVLMADLELKNLGECIKLIQEGKDALVPWENKDPMAIINLIDDFIIENYKWNKK